VETGGKDVHRVVETAGEEVHKVVETLEERVRKVVDTGGVQVHKSADTSGHIVGSYSAYTCSSSSSNSLPAAAMLQGDATSSCGVIFLIHPR